MILPLNKNSFFIFDLDDTLYPEIEFLESGYKYIAKKILPVIGKDIYEEMLGRYHKKENVLEWIESSFPQCGLSVNYLLQLYRDHKPNIKLFKGAKELLDYLRQNNIPLGLITDGRSITQRNKLASLGVDDYFKEVIISEEFGYEKPNEKNYLHFEQKYPGKSFLYIGDNTCKDFTVPLRLGWKTICLKDGGRNIHKQNIKGNLDVDLIIDSLDTLLL